MPKEFTNTDEFSNDLRLRAVDLDDHRVLITNFYGSKQEQDLTKPPNCSGFGRIRHFRLATSPGWPQDPLPIEPACRALGLGNRDELQAQVFQIAVCNWRCWYCFVDYALLSANPKHAAFLTPGELVDLYSKEPNRPHVIDLSGGNPGLVPEWVPWMMQELRLRGLDRGTYLWSDDNLSNDYFWRYLSPDDIELICNYPNYGKVCCFKGFDEVSFSFNTRAAPELFDWQFELMRRFLRLDLDLYCYATFTTPVVDGVADHMTRFVDRLQKLDPNLPLRTIPLEIRVYGPMKGRLQTIPSEALTNQGKAVEVWMKELAERYSHDQLTKTITEVPLRNHRARQKRGGSYGTCSLGTDL